MLVFFSALFLSLAAYLTTVGVYKRNEYAKKDLGRSLKRETTVQRGDIYDRNGEKLAYTEIKDDKATRVYPYKNLYSHLIGYYTEKRGSSLLENRYSNTLNSVAVSDDVVKIASFLNNKKPKGSDLYISEYLQQNAPEPEDQIRLLQERFRISSIRENITRRIIEDYIRRHPYSGEHLARLDKLCSDRPDKEQLIRKFRDKRYASPGAPLPDAVFEDKNGQEHRLTEFAGKYIYIDLWASWCAPCVAEVPHLQKLEKDLNRRDIVFVSISLDTKRENWEKQMEQLHMHGNQWLVRDEAFADMMNVKGIPHFLLYGKDGTLLDYKTARPSSGDLLKSRLEHLP